MDKARALTLFTIAAMVAMFVVTLLPRVAVAQVNGVRLVAGINIVPYIGATTSLPEALTNIGPNGLNAVDIVWARGDWTNGEWWFYDATSPLGSNMTQLDNGRAYVIVATEDCTYSGVQDYISLHEEYQALQSEYDALINQYQRLEDDYNALNGEYQALQSDYDVLQKEYQFSEARRIGHLLQDYYTVVRDLIQGDLFWWTAGGSQGQVDFAANLASHNLGHLYWVSPEAEFVELSGGQHSDELARTELEEVIAFIGIEPTDSSMVIIEKILAFINKYVHYEHDMNDAFLAPVETLAFGSGDCDDYAILGAALFEYFGIESAVGFFSSPDDDSDHAMTLVYVDDLGPYGYYAYEDAEGLAGKWIVIEPQSTIQYQDTSWVAQWNLYVASEVEFLH